MTKRYIELKEHDIEDLIAKDFFVSCAASKHSVTITVRKNKTARTFRVVRGHFVEVLVDGSYSDPKRKLIEFFG